MKKRYFLPQQKIVELDEEEMLNTSPGEVKPMSIELNDYSTYEDTPRTPSSDVNWNGVGTGSDF